MAHTKRLKIKGNIAAYYEINVDVLYLKVVDGFSEDEAIKLISELEKIVFSFVSYLNIDGVE